MTRLFLASVFAFLLLATSSLEAQIIGPFSLHPELGEVDGILLHHSLVPMSVNPAAAGWEAGTRIFVSSLEGHSDELPYTDRSAVAVDHQFSEANVGLGLSYVDGLDSKRFKTTTTYPRLLRNADLTSLMVSYAMDLKNNRELRLGLNLSGSRMELDSVYFSANDSMATYDPVAGNRNFKASIGAGLAYSTKRFQAGLAAWHLNGVKFAYRTGETARLPVRINGHARYMIPISANDESSADDKSWRPSMFIGHAMGQLQGDALIWVLGGKVQWSRGLQVGLDVWDRAALYDVWYLNIDQEVEPALQIVPSVGKAWSRLQVHYSIGPVLGLSKTNLTQNFTCIVGFGEATK